MRAVIQRVKKASVTIENNIRSSIADGMLILLGIENEDNKEDADWLVKKISRLRIFDDGNGVMNNDIISTGGEFLVISQFTLHARTRKGNRPSYVRAATPDIAVPLYKQFVSKLSAESGLPVKTGSFGAKMDVELINSGPVTIIIDSKNRE